MDSHRAFCRDLFTKVSYTPHYSSSSLVCAGVAGYLAGLDGGAGELCHHLAQGGAPVVQGVMGGCSSGNDNYINKLGSFGWLEEEQ